MLPSRRSAVFAFAAIVLAAGTVHARKLLVGPTRTLKAPCAASSQAADGDTIEIDPVTYAGDVCGWSADDLVIRATSPFAHIDAAGKDAQGKGIWVIQGKNTTVENIEFSGAVVPDENGAGMRLDGPGVTIRHCYFHDNENGILGGEGVIVIENSEFAYNGRGEGQTHNMYILEAESFTLTGCYTHHAKIGHTVKSRAKKNYILYNRIMGEAEGTESYEIDLPNGGLSYIIGNLIQQGPDTDNGDIIEYGEEGLKGAVNQLYVSHNTLVNGRGSGTYVNIAGGTTAAKVVNNLFVGAGTLLRGKADTAGNLVTDKPAFVDQSHYDYRLTAQSPAIDKGAAPGSAEGFSLAAVRQYIHPLKTEERAAVQAPDIGAYELGAGSPIRKSIRKPMRKFGAGKSGSGFTADGRLDARPASGKRNSQAHLLVRSHNQ
jgi:hypothetical protein